MFCTKCKGDKPLDEFHRHRGRRTGYASWCKGCCARNMKAQYLARRDERIRYAVERQKESPTRAATLKRYYMKSKNELSDVYIKHRLRNRRAIPYKAIPKVLVDAYRELYKLKLELEKCKTATN